MCRERVTALFGRRGSGLSEAGDRGADRDIDAVEIAERTDARIRDDGGPHVPRHGLDFAAAEGFHRRYHLGEIGRDDRLEPLGRPRDAADESAPDVERRQHPERNAQQPNE